MVKAKLPAGAILLITFAVHAFALTFGPSWLIALTKALLMPALVWSALQLGPNATWLWFVAIGFSWLGDIVLSLPEVYGSAFGEGYFLGGLAAFLVAHVCYVFLAIKQGGRLSPKLAIALVVALAITQAATRKLDLLMTSSISLYVLTLLSLVALLYSTFVKTRSIPETIDASLETNLVSPSTATFTLLGAVLFAFSDLLIAGQKFGPLPENSLLLRLAIMALYVLGQWWLSSLRYESRTNIDHS